MFDYRNVMCSVTKPLPTNLKLKYENRKISIYNGNKDIVVKSELISKEIDNKDFEWIDLFDKESKEYLQTKKEQYYDLIKDL